MWIERRVAHPVTGSTSARSIDAGHLADDRGPVRRSGLLIDARSAALASTRTPAQGSSYGEWKERFR